MAWDVATQIKQMVLITIHIGFSVLIIKVPGRSGNPDEGLLKALHRGEGIPVGRSHETFFKTLTLGGCLVLPPKLNDFT